MLWAEPAGYQLRHAARQRPHPSTRGLARLVILKWPASAAWGPLSPHARVTHQPHPRPRSTCPYPSVPVLPPGTSVRAGSGERWMLAYWAPVWKIPGSWGYALSSVGVMEPMEPCARSRRAGGVWRTKAHVPPPPAPGMCAEALFGPRCPVRDAGGGCPRQVGRGKSLSTRPLQMAPPPRPVPQSSCYGLPGRLPWVTGPRKRERAWDGGSVRAAEPRPTGVGAEL